jgi:arylsulfatase A-like enzyme
LPFRPLSLASALLLAALLPLVPTAPTAAAAPAAPARQRPNFVVVLTDDQTVAQMQFLPATRSLLGGRGVTFTDYVVSYPLCCPSRATLLTGQYTQNNGVANNIDGAGQFAGPVQRTALPVALRRSGYFTGYVGKYLNGYDETDPVPPGWTDWRGATYVNNYRRTRLNENGVITTHRDEFQTDLFARKTTEVLARASDSGRPFYVQLSTYAPHGGIGRTYADRHQHLYADLQAPRGPAYDEEDVSDKPPVVSNRPRLDAAARQAITRTWRQEARSLRAVDDAVARIVRQLRADGELANTTIIVTSDNGFFHGEHRIRSGKFLPYEPSVRVPLLVSGPLVAPELRGGEIDEPTANVDIVPTILDAARSAPLRTPDGVSLMPLLAGEDVGDWTSRSVELVGISGACRSCGYPYSGVRRGDGLVYWRLDRTGRTELYDLTTDPDQLQNLSEDPAYAATVLELEAARIALSSCRGASCGRPGDWTPWSPLD